MGLVMAIVPVVIVGVIVVYVIERLKQKYNQGSLGKKKSKTTHIYLNSLIPIGMLFGCTLGIILGIFFSVSPVVTISLGAGIGYLFGFFAYEFYCKEGNNSS
ncbi:hypothetical protein [Ammoniphilus resinae]|uniref:ABC-type lipoprotein release transport system permease subunit n=1 Tax=Ammoniphilus resinae TaxID=861532 RepID=A0ABS4GP33_9BACL|nr:hypothetical protein [Ammoniphilus resinae]MBP1932021.1 ABC-type lipoprotein release transport system permease subunit [Ammoniphilus resinae]